MIFLFHQFKSCETLKKSQRDTNSTQHDEMKRVEYLLKNRNALEKLDIRENKLSPLPARGLSPSGNEEITIIPSESASGASRRSSRSSARLKKRANESDDGVIEFVYSVEEEDRVRMFNYDLLDYCFCHYK